MDTGGKWVSTDDEGDMWVGLMRELYKAGVIVDTSKFTGDIEVSGLTRAEIDWL